MKLLAKSEPQITLIEHIEDCLKIWNCLKTCFPQIHKIVDDSIFWQALRLAIISHDLGKGHLEFIKLLEQKPNKWQGQRHELFSLPFIDGLDIDIETKKLIKLVVAGHHKDFEKLHQNYIVNAYSNGTATDFGDEGF